MDGPKRSGSLFEHGTAIGLTRRGFLRGLAAGGTAVASVPAVAAFGVSLGRAGAAAKQGETVDVTLIVAPDLPYPKVPTQEEMDADPAKKGYAEAIQPWLDQNPGVKLKEITFDVYDQEALLVAVSGGTAPSFYPADVLAQWDIEKVLAAELSGLAAEVTAQVAQYDLEAKLADYCLPIWNTQKVDGKAYALPYSFNCGDGIHYRIDQFKEAGIPEPTMTWTWANLRDLAKQLTSGTRKGLTLQDWGFSLALDAEGWGWRNQIPAPENDWNWKWDYTTSSDEWVGVITALRDLVFKDEAVLADIAMADDEIVQQFLQGNAAMMNNNITYHTASPTSQDGSMAGTADELGLPIQEVFGFIAHPIGANGYSQTTRGQLDTMALNPDLDEVALDKAASLHVYMMGQGWVLQKQAAFAATNDLRQVWGGGDITPLYKESEIQGVPGTPDEAWGEAFMKNVRDAAAIPLQPWPYWFIKPSQEAGPPSTAYEDARSKWFYEGGDQDIASDLQQIQDTTNQQAESFTTELPDDQWVAGAKQYYEAMDTYFSTNMSDFYEKTYKPWYDQLVAPALG